jgi:hypothetical protein
MLDSISILGGSHDEATSSVQTMNWDIESVNDTSTHDGGLRTLLTTVSSFFTELKRRKVYRVEAAYAVASWLLIQAASIFLPIFDAPPCMMRGVVLFLALGFVVSGVLSWVFDITPQGIRRTADISPDQTVDVVRQLQEQARQEFVRGYLSALVYTGRGDKTRAIDYLNDEYLNHQCLKYNNDRTGMSVDAMLDELRRDPRFEALAAKAQ